MASPPSVRVTSCRFYLSYRIREQTSNAATMVGRPPDVRALTEHLNCALAVLESQSAGARRSPVTNKSLLEVRRATRRLARDRKSKPPCVRQAGHRRPPEQAPRIEDIARRQTVNETTLRQRRTSENCRQNPGGDITVQKRLEQCTSLKEWGIHVCKTQPM